jgi:phosphoglycolate phosphatase-like HAD superfamily hydrolase
VKITSSQNFLAIVKQSSAILFDLDQTLYSLNVNWNAIRNYIVNHYNRNYEPILDKKQRFFEIFDVIEQTQGKEGCQFYRHYMRDQELIAIKEHNYAVTWLMGYGLERFSEYLRFDCFFGIISNNFHDSIVEILEQNNSLHKFKVIIGRDDVTKEKPNPEGLIRVMDGYDLLPEKVLFIGDSKTDEEAADRAQVHFVYVDDLKKILESESFGV